MNEDMITQLIDLSQLDIDAVSAYNQALEKIDDVIVHREIESFRDDHLRHIDELNALIKQYGGTPPERSKDFKGYIIEGFTALRSITGTRGALSAMEGNEKLTNKNYKSALEKSTNFPPEVVALIQKNYADEKRHLQYIQMTLEEWDRENK